MANLVYVSENITLLPQFECKLRSLNAKAQPVEFNDATRTVINQQIAELTNNNIREFLKEGITVHLLNSAKVASNVKFFIFMANF